MENLNLTWDLIGLFLAYAGAGIGILLLGFWVLDVVTGPHSLAADVQHGNKGAGLIAGTNFLALGLILYFAIHFTGSDWKGVGDVAVFGGLGVVVQAIGFKLLDVLVPGHLGDHCCDREGTGDGIPAAAKTVAGMQLAIALIVCASLT